MTPQELKNSILQLAIQGKLVEQRPEEGVAEVPAALQHGGKEARRHGEIEPPFDIPESWRWVRFGNAITLLSGTDFPPDQYNNQGVGIPYITGASSLSETGVLVNRWTKTPRIIAKRGDILLVCKGSGYGKTVVCDIDEAHIARQIMAVQQTSSLDMRYVRYFLMANFQLIKSKGQGVIPGIDRKSVLQMMFPLPPLAEQKRIVSKIEELLPLLARYEQAWTKLEAFNTRFPSDLQKSLLQLAIQGKLVEQRPEEGSGESLYRQIQSTRQHLVKTGMIKRDKRTNTTETPPEDIIPFDIPEGWKWVYLGSILNKLTDGTHKTPKYSTSGIKFVSVKDMSNGVLSLNNTKFITVSEHEELYARCNPERGDMLLSKVGTTGVPAIVDTDEPFSLFVSVALLKYSHEHIDERFLYYLLKSPLVQMQAEDNTRGVGNKNWVLDAIAKTLVPLPPLAEQKRIVTKLEELLPLCERLK